MDFKKTFLALTQWTVPYGYEQSLEQYLPKGVTKDEHGNYHITIGESRTLFTSHLDTCSSKRQKIKHVINGNIIKTDGTTILGGDNKAGVCILFYLIEQRVPGTYYFFIGEEVGTIGSQAALNSKYEYFMDNYDRCVAFDRKKTGSIITNQLGRDCCSDLFAGALGKEFAKSGLVYKADPTGVYTDSAVFMDVIPECTNLSAGVWGEHSNQEYVDIKIVEEIAKAAAKIDWESLPIARDPEEEYQGYGKYGKWDDDYLEGEDYYSSTGDEDLYDPDYTPNNKKTNNDKNWNSSNTTKSKKWWDYADEEEEEDMAINWDDWDDDTDETDYSSRFSSVEKKDKKSGRKDWDYGSDTL
jgi:hypothetical protein